MCLNLDSMQKAQRLDSARLGSFSIACPDHDRAATCEDAGDHECEAQRLVQDSYLATTAPRFERY